MLNIGAHPDGVSVAFSGEIDYEALPQIRQVVSEALTAAEGRRVEFDLAGVTFIDSSGLGMVVDARTACESQGTTFTITGVSDRVRRVFVLSGLEMLLASTPEPPSA